MEKIVKVFLVLFVLIAGAVWFVHGKMAEDPGITIPMAFGYPDDDTVELHVMVDLGMIRREAAELDERGRAMWNEWVDAHFTMVDADGADVPLTRISQSQLIPEHKVGGVPEFYLKVRLKKGAQYTLDYIPRQMEAGKYRNTFTAPTEEKDYHRYSFLPPEDAPVAE